MSAAKLRPAQKSDAADLAILDNLAGHGISLWYWQKAMGGNRFGEALVHGRNRMADKEAIFGWSNTMVAIDEEDCILGALNSYQMPQNDEDAEDLKRTAPIFVPVFELFNLVVGNWLIDSLAVYTHVQGQGIGALLLDDALNQARDADLTAASLVVEDSNKSAIGLYQSRGFELVESRKFIEFDGPAPTKNWLLMTTTL